MKKLITILMITLLLSSCALLDRLRGAANPHSEMIQVPVPTSPTEDIVVPTVDADDIRG